MPLFHRGRLNRENRCFIVAKMWKSELWGMPVIKFYTFVF